MAPADPEPSPDGRRRWLLAELAAVAAATGLLLWLLRRVLFHPVATFGHDFVFWYPVWQFYAEGLSLGELRLWNPLSYGGVPLLPALLQLRVFDPISFLTIVAGDALTTDLLARYNWDVFLRAWIPAVAAHAFLRRFADHGLSRVALAIITLCSSFLLVMLRVPGAGQGFLWAPLVALLLHRVIWLGDGRWTTWAGLAIFLGLNWQSYFAAPHLTLVALLVLGVALYHPERLRAVARIPQVGAKAALAVVILTVMFLPLAGVLPEIDEIVYLPRLLETGRPRGDVGPVQYEPIPSETVREVGLLMPPEFLVTNGTPSTIWNFLQLVSPTGNWHREGGHGWGNPEEAFMYLGLPVYAVALVGLLLGRHPLRRPWIVVLTVFGLLTLGPLGGAQSVLAWVFPLVRFVRHTHTYTPYVLLAILFFFVLGCNRLLRDLLGLAPAPVELEPAPPRWLRLTGVAIGAFFILYLLVVATPTAFRFFSTGKAVTPATVAVGLVAVWWLWKRLAPGRLLWVLLLGHLAAVPVLLSVPVLTGLHTAPAGGLPATLGWLAGYWALFLGLPLLIWWGSRRSRAPSRVAAGALFILLVGDQLFYVSYTDYLWHWPRPDRVLGVSAEVTPLQFHGTRALYPAGVERTRIFGQAIRYPELLLRTPYLLTAPRDEPPSATRTATTGDVASRLDALRDLRRWNSFYVPRRYLGLLHSEMPAPVLARLWSLEEPMLRLVPRYTVVPDSELEGWIESLGARQSRCILGRVVVLPEEPAGLDSLAVSRAELAGGPACEEAPAPSVPVTSVKRYEADTIELDIQASNPGFLLVSDTFHPRWRARLDGRAVPVLRADYLLKAVAIPAGRHTVALELDAGFLPAALTVFTLLGLGALTGAVVGGGMALGRQLRTTVHENH